MNQVGAEDGWGRFRSSRVAKPASPRGGQVGEQEADDISAEHCLDLLCIEPLRLEFRGEQGKSCGINRHRIAIKI